MDATQVRALLDGVAAGTASPAEALAVLASGPLAGLTGSPVGAGGARSPAAGVLDIGFARLDTHRALRTGDPEVVYAAGKEPGQVVALLRALADQPGGAPAVATRVDTATRDAVRAALPAARVDDLARVVVLGELPAPVGTVCVLSAGTSDAPVAAEAALVARAFGAGVELVPDVGVAGLHRLLAVREVFEAADALVVVAGMDGALPSVVGGLTGVPLVAVPTSVGYGASLGGVGALLAMLGSCAPGVVVVNIDNGFGAGVHAARVARRSAVRPGQPGEPGGPGQDHP